MNHNPCAIGIDIGGTKIAGGLVDHSGRLLSDVTIRPTPARAGAAAILEAVGAMIQDLLAQGREPIQGIGVGSAGVIDESGVVASATDLLPGWSGTDIPAGLSRFGLPVAVINDVHAFGYGEAWTGAARGHQDVLAVAVGTGIGGVILADGRPVRGRTGTAGSIGHIDSPHATGLTCSCGQSGHLEAVASGPALEANYRRRSGESLPLPEISLRAREGDTAAQAVLELAATSLGRTLAGITNILDPGVIVIGGGVAGLGGEYLAGIMAEVHRSALPRPSDITIRAGKLGNSANVLGAARWFLTHHSRQ